MKYKIEFLYVIFKKIIDYIKTTYKEYIDVKYYSVGGINRDLMLGIGSKDLDIVITNVHIIQNKNYFDSFAMFMSLFRINI